MKNKGTALITGAAVRIGRSIALKLADLGFNIALHCRSSRSEAGTLQKLIQKKKVAAQIFPCDLSDQVEVFKLIPKIKREFPDLNVLVNSASIFEESTLSSLEMPHYERHWNINFKAPFILTSEFAKNVRTGNVINILDTNVVKNRSKHLIYLLTKKALLEFTKLSATELAPKIRVNAVAPGVILPPPGESSIYLNKRAKNVPLKTKGSPKQIAECVAFLINNPYITGQVIFNDGGEHLLA